MSGTVHGVVDGGGTNQEIWKHNHDFFTRLFKFFQASSRHTIIAYNKGNTGGNVNSAVPGTDYWDGANPFGRQAWFVVRFTNASKVWYALFEYYDGSSVTPQYGGVLAGSTSSSQAAIGFQCCAAVDSGGAVANPFQGTMVATGTDTRPAGVWWAAPGGGRLYAFPRSCNPGGTWATNRNNMVSRFVASGFTVQINRWSFWADDDAMGIVYDSLDDGTVESIYMGLYSPVSTVATVDVPICMVAQSASSDAFSQISQSSSTVTVWGDLTTGNNSTDGGVHGPIGVTGASSSYVYSACVSSHVGSFTANVNLKNNRFISPASGEEWPLYIGGFESTGAYGLLGTLFQHRVTTYPNNKDTNAAKTRAYFGTAPNSLHAIPWDGSTTPGTSTGRGTLYLWPSEMLRRLLYRFSQTG